METTMQFANVFSHHENRTWCRLTEEDDDVRFRGECG